MSNFQPSSSSNWFIKLIPTITTMCVTLGAVAIYDFQANKSLLLTNEVGSGAAQIPGSQGPAGAQGATGPAGAQGATGPAGSSGSSGGSGMILKDAKQVVVSNFVSFRDESIIVFKNDRFFSYGGSLSEGFSGIPRGYEWEETIFLTSNCTGTMVIDGRSQVSPSYSIVTWGDNGTVFTNDNVYRAGDLSSSPAQLYRLNEDNSCSNLGLIFYRQAIALPTSDLPPVLASPIRISFN